ncbi:hypothetical protein BU26DRAFT_565614 [Trematosphaeria pertusa]|uniref:Uncharacterized protein n=1 Tax=Trematosphaeria pertusa TaxID=390896 RepID=A0A6A6ICR2_9PLEO|nr:uncharacterized protein BU26DRAFT_565614 [Trematosphaeria pertusa]KAF2248206.1 hypothetical protein BU26DRAFT_565614 [Trematosphaeria pertusa]
MKDPGHSNGKALNWAYICQRTRVILTEGPASPAEWWIYELAKYGRRDPDAVSMKFEASTLCEAFNASHSIFPACPSFLRDIYHLLAMLPIKSGQAIERKLLIELLWEAARECGMDWWSNMRDRAAVVFGVMHACMIHRRIDAQQTEDELGSLLEKMDLGDDEVEVMNRLAEELEGELKIKL